MGVDMKFDLGEVLTRAWQITWNHKLLWVFNILPVLLSLLFLPVIFIPIFFMGPNPFTSPDFFQEPGFGLLFVGVNLLNGILSILLYARGISSASLGILRVEEGEPVLSFRELFQEGAKFFGRVLGIMLLVGLGVSLVFLLFFGCLMLIGTVTMGIGMICIQPLFLLIYPAALVVYALLEQSLAAVIVDDKGVSDALSRGWDLIRNNFWSIILVTLIVYLGITILSSIVMLPFMVPFFFLPLFMENSQVEFSIRTFGLIMAVFSIFLLPIIAVVQGFSLTYMKSTFMLVYLRLTRSPKLQPLPGTVEATS
jgi:hypothetical protein